MRGYVVASLLACALTWPALAGCGDDADAGDGPGATPPAGSQGSAQIPGDTDTATPSAAPGPAVGEGDAASDDDGTRPDASVTPQPVASDLTPYEACVHYEDARCNRFQFECRGGEKTDNPCPEARTRCPDLYFSAGSRVTVEDLVSCAAQWANHPCELAQRYIGPECLPDGSLAVDAPCLFNAQCEGGLCAYAGADCRRCAVRVEQDGPCDESFECPGNQRCENGVCTSNFERVGQPLGEACDPNWVTCAVGLRCFPDPDGVARCQQLPGAGEPCPASDCDDTALCQDGTCGALPGDGEACQPWITEYLICAPDSYCDEGNGAICRPRKSLGERCELTDYEVNGAQRVQPQCAEGLRCDCPEDVGCNGTCIERLWAGDDCTREHTRCADGTLCVDGLCEGVESQGLFGPMCE